MKFNEYLEISTQKRFGKLIIIGTRIFVNDVLTWLSLGMSRKDILLDYPELTIEQINACLTSAVNKEQRYLLHHEAIV